MNYTKSVSIKGELAEAFAALRKLGFIAKMNFSCCGSCAGYEIATSVGEMPESKRAKIKGVITYNKQRERDVKEGGVYLVFGPVELDGVGEIGLPAEEGAKIIIQELQRTGLHVEWNGDPAECIWAEDVTLYRKRQKHGVQK